MHLALLLSFVEDPVALAGEIKPFERRWLRRRAQIDDPRALCWTPLDVDQRQRGLFALRTLAAFRAR